MAVQEEIESTSEVGESIPEASIPDASGDPEIRLELGEVSLSTTPLPHQVARGSAQQRPPGSQASERTPLAIQEQTRTPSESLVCVPAEVGSRVSAYGACRSSAGGVSDTLAKQATREASTAPSVRNESSNSGTPAVDVAATSPPSPGPTTTPPAATALTPVVSHAPVLSEIREITLACDEPAPSVAPGLNPPAIAVSASDEPAPSVAPALNPAAIVAEAADGVGLKEVPKVAAEAVLHAGQAYVKAGKTARSTIKDLISLRNKEGPVVTLTTDEILTAAFLVLVGVQLLFMLLFRPSAFRLVYSLFCGLAFGLGLSFLFYRNKKRKAEINELLSVNLGFKGVQLVAGGLPAMFNLSDKEKMEWLNALIVEVWPYVDKGVCEMIKDITAQVMPGILASLPAGLSGLVKTVAFKHLTFGSAPIRIESMWVSPDDKEYLGMEVSVKWTGDPNITLAIELPTGQKLCPRIMDITFIATVRLKLGPMVSRLPGFVAAMATMPSSPMINYRLDFGKAMGGSVVPLAVTPVINYFVRDLVDQMLVWPQRLVTPIMVTDSKDLISIQRLMRAHRGMLRVQILRGKDLDGLGPFDKSCAVLTTDSEYYASTRHQAPDLPPVGLENIKNLPTGPVDWNDTVHLLVQEPDSQMLRLEVFDLTAGRGGRSLSVSGRRLVGRALIKLAKVCKAGLAGDLDPVSMVAQLGKQNWGTPGGPGKGCGKAIMRLTYFPFASITQQQALQAQKGIMVVRVLAFRGIPVAGTAMSVYASISTRAEKAAGKDSYRIGRRNWFLSAHAEALKRKVKALEAQRAKNLKEGRTKEAEQAAADIQELNLEATNPKDIKFNGSYQLDPYASRVLYNASEKLVSGEDNKVVVKVYRQGKAIKGSNELAGVVEVPVAEVKQSLLHNPLSGRDEYGLWFRGRSEYLVKSPDDRFDDSDWGLPLEQGCGGRVLFTIRWVPCIESDDNVLPDDEDDANPPADAMPPSSPLGAVPVPAGTQGAER